MNEVIENKSCSILNNVNLSDSIDLSKIVEGNLKQSSSYYVEHFKAFAIKTAQSTLEMCRVVAEAKKALAKDRFLTFCKDIGHEQEDATIRKYITIGNKYEQFIKYAELLPNSWTSIYAITQLPSEVFESLVLTGNSMANMTGDQIKQLIAPKKSDETQTRESDKPEPSNIVVGDGAASTNPTDPPNDSTTLSKVNAGSVDQVPNSNASTSASMPSGAATDNGHTSWSTRIDLKPNDDSAVPSDLDFAKQPTSKVLETAKASSPISVDAEDEFKPYIVTIRFKKKLSIEDTNKIQELVYSLSKKYDAGIEVKHEDPVAA